MSEKVFAANWKMYLNDNESKEFISRICLLYTSDAADE